MQYFYDGQIRRYLLQIVRLLSNFVVKYGDGTLERVPVVYGDIERQVANILNQNSENALLSTPKISVYISDFQLDKERLSDASYIGKLHIRERNIVNGSYGYAQGENYTIERLMPTPFKLSVKVDIISSNTDQKLQILEQILVMFNPSLEIQTTDNYIDWTSLSVVDLENVVFTSKTIPAGTNQQADIATLTLNTPVWISPPVKVKHLGVITEIISNIYGNSYGANGNYIDGLGVDLYQSDVMSNPLYTQKTTIQDFNIIVNEKNVYLRHLSSNGQNLSWYEAVEQFPGAYKPGLAKLFLKQPGFEVVGFATINPIDDTILNISQWDIDTYPTNNLIPGPARSETAWGTFDAIIDPTKNGPENVNPGTRYLIIEGIGGGIRESGMSDVQLQVIDTGIDYNLVYNHKLFVNGVEVNSIGSNNNNQFTIIADSLIPANTLIVYELYLNESGPVAWKNADGSDFIAGANDIIEWDGYKWNIVFSAKDSGDTLIYQTNIYTLTQYKWNGVAWVKSFEGEYQKGSWRLEL